MSYLFEKEFFYKEDARRAGAARWQMDLLKIYPDYIFKPSLYNNMSRAGKGSVETKTFEDWHEFDDWVGDAANIRFLERIEAQVVHGGLTGDNDNRYGIHISGENAGDGIRSTWS